MSIRYTFQPVTDYAQFHGAFDGPMKDAVATVPGYAEASTKFAGARERITAYMARLAVPQQVDPGRTLACLLATGEPLPPTLATDLWEEARDRRAQYANLEAAADRALQILSGERDRVLRAGRDKVLAHLDAAVCACVVEARGLDLNGAHDAESAIERGVGDAWGGMRSSLARYVKVRTAQELAIRVLYNNETHGLVGTFGFIENFAELIPTWLDISRGRTFEFEHGQIVDVRGDDVWPWIAVPPRGESAPADTHEARFAWLVATPDARPWVPTPEQATAAHAAALANITSARTPSPEHAERVARQVKRAARSATAASEANAHLAVMPVTPRPPSRPGPTGRGLNVAEGSRFSDLTHQTNRG